MLCVVSSVALVWYPIWGVVRDSVSMVTLYLQQRLKIAVMDMDCNRRENLPFQFCQGEVGKIFVLISFHFFEKLDMPSGALCLCSCLQKLPRADDDNYRE